MYFLIVFCKQWRRNSSALRLCILLFRLLLQEKQGDFAEPFGWRTEIFYFNSVCLVPEILESVEVSK